MDYVADPGAGAISTFSGVTRNNFHGKAVLKLEYECYTPMALKVLQVSMGVRAQGSAAPQPGGLYQHVAARGCRGGAR